MLHWQHAPSDIVPLVKDLLPGLMQQPFKTVEGILVQTWPDLQGQRQVHVAFALKLLEKCFQWVRENSPGDAAGLRDLEGSMERLALLQVRHTSKHYVDLFKVHTCLYFWLKTCISPSFTHVCVIGHSMSLSRLHCKLRVRYEACQAMTTQSCTVGA